MLLKNMYWRAKGSPKKDATKHFATLERTGKQVGSGNVICLCSDILPIDKKNYFVSVMKRLVLLRVVLPIM